MRRFSPCSVLTKGNQRSIDNLRVLLSTYPQMRVNAGLCEFDELGGLAE
jgi:hypothetical protein